MYTPELFKQEDREKLLAVMRGYPFATVISWVDDAPMVSHLPILTELVPASREIILTSHLARANPHSRHLAQPGEALFIFHGPQTYITPSWYKDPLNVPTWNYAVVHAYGTPKLVEDYEGIHRILDRTVEVFEKPEPKPWQFALPEDFKQDLVGAIVGFEVRVSRIEGKFKLSQNRAPEDRAGVLGGLSGRSDEMSQGVLRLMQRTPPA